MEYSNPTQQSADREGIGCPGGHTQRAFAIYHTWVQCLQQIQELVECCNYTRSILALCTWRALDPCSPAAQHSWAGGDSGRMIPNNNTRQCESCPEKGNPLQDNNHHRSLIIAYHSRPTGFIFSVIDPRDQQLGWFESGRQVEEEGWGWGLVLPSDLNSYYYVCPVFQWAKSVNCMEYSALWKG